jgi:pimeloyl-ACP methyl ester carboxylesterase
LAGAPAVSFDYPGQVNVLDGEAVVETRSSNRIASQRESVVLLASAAVVGVNVVVDSLIALRPGARLADHIPEVAVLLVLLAFACVIHRRLRPGLRAAEESLIGFLALTWAGLMFADIALTGFRAHYIPGLLLVPAGAALLLEAGWVLIRSQRPGRFRYLRRAAWVVAVVLAAYWVVLPVGMAAYATHRPQTAVGRTPVGVQYEDVAVETSDGVRLQGWYIPSRNGAAVVAYPREWTVAHAEMLAGQGYGVLLLDMRGYGASEGDPNAFGWGCTRDIDAGLAFLQSRPDVEDGRIGGLGLSVGAEQMIEAAAANPALQAVVADGAGERSVRESLIRGPKGYFALPMMAVQTAAVAVFSGQPAPPALDELAAAVAPRALLLIHAENGGGGEELVPEYFAAAGEPKSVWLIPQGEHTAGLTERPQEYAQRVGEFLAATLLR